ncbi:pectate lyase family protein [Mucisphaera calidilacus]|nr:hypothetical protein [Mucisphaera calidilacus]
MVTVINSTDHGAIGDGNNDDTAAIASMLATLEVIEGPARLQFESNRVYRIAKPVIDGFAIKLMGRVDVTIDGGQSTFLLAPNVRFLHAIDCTHLSVQGIRIDYDPLPFVEADIIDAQPGQPIITVRSQEGFDLRRSGGPTRDPDEQAYFGMSWHQGPHSLIGHHQMIEEVEHLPDNTARIRLAHPYEPVNTGVDHIPTITLPVPGIAHLQGPGHVFKIYKCHSADLEDIEVWSAPWFAFGIFGNTGDLTFRHTHVRPKPGSSRTTSTWRDAFHVKNNAASLLFEDIHAQGCNDDTFNISSHGSRVWKQIDEQTFDLVQVYPLEITPLNPGDQVAFYDPTNHRFLANARLVSVQGEQAPEFRDGQPYSPILRVRVDRPVPSVVPNQTLFWSVTYSNPQTTLRRVRLYNSARLRSPVTIEDSHIEALLWITGWSDGTELPVPTDIVIRDSLLRYGRGNPTHAIIATPLEAQGDTDSRHLPGTPPVTNVVFERNRIFGGFYIGQATGIRLIENEFITEGHPIELFDIRAALLHGNTVDGEELKQKHLTLRLANDTDDVRITP